MPNITVYIPQELNKALKQHKGINKSQIVAEALRGHIDSGKCECKNCVKKREKISEVGRI